MINKGKKKAFAFIESLVILMLVILLVTISLNLIGFNYLKSKTYNSYSDKKSLNLEVEIILKEINTDIDIEKYINKEKKYEKNKYSLIEKNKIFYLVEKLSDSNMYIELEIKEYNDKKIFVPTYYKTKNIVGDKL
jgi:uncharacterized ion transporter superfamily protein YfcC